MSSIVLFKLQVSNSPGITISRKNYYKIVYYIHTHQRRVISMFKFLPRPRSPYWFLAGAALSILTTLLYLAFFALIFGRDPSGLNIPGILLIFVVVSQLIVLGGYLGFPLYLAFSTIGFVFGLGLFISMLSNTGGGFEDLVGAISFFMLTAGGIAAGIVAELVRFIWKRTRKNI